MLSEVSPGVFLVLGEVGQRPPYSDLCTDRDKGLSVVCVSGVFHFSELWRQLGEMLMCCKHGIPLKRFSESTLLSLKLRGLLDLTLFRDFWDRDI